MKFAHTEVKFYPEVKPQTGLSSLRVSCKGAVSTVIRVMLNGAPYSLFGTLSGFPSSLALSHATKIENCGANSQKLSLVIIP